LLGAAQDTRVFSGHQYLFCVGNVVRSVWVTATSFFYNHYTVKNVRNNTRAQNTKELHPLVADTIKSIQEFPQAKLLNDAAVTNSFATACLRAKKPMMANRIFTPAHEHLIVFFKGDNISSVHLDSSKYNTPSKSVQEVVDEYRRNYSTVDLLGDCVVPNATRSIAVTQPEKWDTMSRTQKHNYNRHQRKKVQLNSVNKSNTEI